MVQIRRFSLAENQNQSKMPHLGASSGHEKMVAGFDLHTQVAGTLGLKSELIRFGRYSA